MANWFMAGLTLAAALAVPLVFPLQWVFDPTSPDFNPMVLLPLFLAGTGVRYLVPAVIGTIRQRRFGTTVLELTGARAGRLGSPLRGVIRTQGTLHPQGDYRIVLQCLDTHAFAKSRNDAGSRSQAFVVWEQALEVPSSGIDSRKGVPFSFQLPASVGKLAEPEASSSGAPMFSFKVAFHLPGMRSRILTHNAAPASRHWQVVVSAPMPGTDFRAQLPVAVE